MAPWVTHHCEERWWGGGEACTSVKITHFTWKRGEVLVKSIY